MSENDCVELERTDDNIIIKKVEHSTKVTLDEIFSGFDDDYEAEPFDWGKPIGKEVW